MSSYNKLNLIDQLQFLLCLLFVFSQEGFREGAMKGHEAAFQSGFDTGYAQGFETAFTLGKLNGIIE